MDGLLSAGYESLREFVAFGYRNSWWMGWNLLLGWIPVALGVALFLRRRPRTLPWWVMLALFILFLPNAPYVITDLVHLRWAVTGADSNREVLTAVLPVFAMFIAAGYLAYYLCLKMVDQYLERAGMSPGWRRATAGATHVVCALGVVLGRFARLNSWEPVMEPRGTIEQIVVTLTWDRAPAAFLLILGAIVGCHLVTKALIEGVVVPAVRAYQGRLGPLGRARPATG